MSDLQRFVALLASRLGEDEHLTSCAFVGDPANQPRESWSASTVWKKDGRWLVKGNPAMNRYITVAAFRVDPTSGRLFRQMDFYAGTVALMVDDVGTKVKAEDLADVVPTAIIETSKGNYQYWYVFEELCRSKPMMDALADSFVAKYTSDGKDPGMKGVTRVGRVPDSTNAKASCGPDGWAVRLAAFNPVAIYTPKWLAAELGISLQVRAQAAAPTTGDAAKEERRARFAEIKPHLHPKRDQPNNRGWTEIVCPWVWDHTGAANNGASICEPNEFNRWFGGFQCHHGHCVDKEWKDVDDWFTEEHTELLEAVNAAASDNIEDYL